MQVPIMQFLSYTLITLPYTYFLNRFLTPKRNRRQSILGCYIVLFILTIIICSVFYEKAAWKPILTVLTLYLCTQLFYTGTQVKKIVAPFLIVALSILVEVPYDYIVIYVMKIKVVEIYQSSTQFFLFQLLVNILLLIIFKFLLGIFEQKGYFTKRYAPLIMIISVQFFMTVTCISQIQFMELIHIDLVERMQYAIVMFIVSIITDISALYFLKHLYQKTKVELSVQKMEKEYAELLTQYLDDRQNEVYRYLRHDIMNYLIHNEEQLL